MLCLYFEFLYFVKYNGLTEYLTLFSWFALLVNQCFDSKEFERCEIWTMFASVGPLCYEQIIYIMKLSSFGSNSLAVVTSSTIAYMFIVDQVEQWRRQLDK